MNTPLAAEAKHASRFPMLSLWLVTLLPGNALVLLDVQRGVVRPGVWLARFLPALVVLAVVLWALVRSTPFALRLRRELRLALAPGLLLSLFSGAALSLDGLGEGPMFGVVSTMPWVLGFVLPSAMLLMPMSVEREQGTLLPLLTSPLGGRAFAEKFALGSVLVVLSWLQLAGVQRETQMWWFALAGHVLALATVPTWFFLTQDDETTVGFIVLVPFFGAAPLALLLPAAVLPAAALYGVVMLGLLPAALRRGVATGAPAWLRRDVPGISWLERWARPVLRAELRGQRDTIVLGGVAVLIFGVFQVLELGEIGDTEAGPISLFIFSGVGALLSPLLSFSEAQRLGTLDAMLTVQPRQRVFTRRALGSAVTTVVVSMLGPAVVCAATSRLSVSGVVAWVLAMSVLWSVGLAVSVHFASVGTALATGVGVAFALVMTHVALMVAAVWGTASLLDAAPFPQPGPFLAAVLVIIAGVALGVAWRRFMTADRLEPRVLVSATAVSLAHAAVLGAASVVATLL